VLSLCKPCLTTKTTEKAKPTVGNYTRTLYLFLAIITNKESKEMELNP
jgi:hypothetical protein